MGMPVLEVLPPHSNILSIIFDSIREKGRTVFYEDLPLFYSRDGNKLAEGYFPLKTTPWLGDSGDIEGFHQLITESTNRILLQRRIDTFTDIGAQMMEARKVLDIWQLIIDSMARNDKDISFAVIYSLVGDTVKLKGSINLFDGHPARIESFNLEKEHSGFGPIFQEIMNCRKLLVVHVADGSLPKDLV